MASFLRPRRGKKATAISQGLVLKRGEFFVEVPDSGVGTGVGKIKMGDGSTSYTNLPYLVSTEDDKIGFTDTSAATDPSNNPTYLTNIAPGNNLKTVFTNLKQLVYNHNTQLAELNNDLTAMEGVTEVPFKFEYDSTSGKYGYRDGADTFRPFNDGSGGGDLTLLYTNPSPGNSYTTGTLVQDTTYYRYIFIKYRPKNSEPTEFKTIQIDREKSYISSSANNICLIDSARADSTTTYARQITVSSNTSYKTKVAISIAYALNVAGTDTTRCIPLNVWGSNNAVIPQPTPILESLWLFYDSSGRFYEGYIINSDGVFYNRGMATYNDLNLFLAAYSKSITSVTGNAATAIAKLSGYYTSFKLASNSYTRGFNPTYKNIGDNVFSNNNPANDAFIVNYFGENYPY